AHRTARRHAVHDAVRRAREYAEALDTTVAALLELTDTATGGPRPRSTFDRHAVRFSRAAADTEPQAPEPLDLEPQRIQVRAEVSARFTMNPPAL
ncbi:SIMPL domain-containing protein, partial [Streptomyces sp. ID05-04B]